VKGRVEIFPERLPPAAAGERARLRALVSEYARRERLVPPLSREELESHAALLLAQNGLPPGQRSFMAMLLTNAVWREVVASVPFDRRLLLLPQCLRRQEICRGERDEAGLLCARCGACDIDGILREAEALGYVTLVAEGATVVRMLLSGGKIDAVIGVGCLDSLERVFPDMARHAIPGLAVPLLTDGCRDTTLDRAWLSETMRLHAPQGPRPLPDLERLQGKISGWFTPAQLAELLGRPRAQVERLAQSWLATGGKRWRPLLTVAVHDVLNDADAGDEAHAAAVAIECFHKASLIHDDIEDGDDRRYGRPTPHALHGVPIATNVGDFLIGEGYRLLTGLPVDPVLRLRMLTAAAAGHRRLCLGQGEELAFAARPHPLTISAYERLCARKTGAAFEVAIALGAILAGADQSTCGVLSRYSRAVGVAYQIRDDLADAALPDAGDLQARRPSILLALACECEAPAVAAALARLWRHGAGGGGDAAGALMQALTQAGLPARAEQLAEHHLHAAERALAGLRHAGLKRLLRRLAARLLEASP
jgi:geranylgeranyl pyrophosphate synthase